jgi:hypothetical protein
VVAVKSSISKVGLYFKVNAFRLSVIVALGALTFSQYVQYSISGINYFLTKTNTDYISNVKSEFEHNMAKDKVFMLMEIDETQKDLVHKIEQNRRSLSARLDVVDSATDPDKKRRKLIAKVRRAITENTDTKLDVRTLNRIAIAVIDYSYQYNLKIPRVLAQIKRESDFVVKAKSRAGAQGLLQIMPKTMKTEIIPEIGVKLNAWSIYDNIKAGCFYMSEMLHLNNGHYDDALRSYNFGYSNVLKVKAGELDFSLTRVVEENGKEIAYLVSRRGEFILGEDGKKIRPVLEDRYPRETRNYVRSINKWTVVFKRYGLEE